MRIELVIAAMCLLLCINVATKATEVDDAVTVALKVRGGQLLSEAFLHVSDYDRLLVLPEGLQVGRGLVLMVRGPAPQGITLSLSVSDFPDEDITYQLIGSESNSQVLKIGGSVQLNILFEAVDDYGLILCRRSENGVLIPFDGMLPDILQEVANNPRSNHEDREKSEDTLPPEDDSEP